MAYTVLARRYRSQTFDDIIGQDAIAQTMKNAIVSGRVAHAYLFCGTRGVGKTSIARVLAKSLNCLESDGPTVTPCCKCDSCVAINNGEDIDVIEIDGASNNGVDNIRELRQNAIYRPARARFKIYIIDEIHMLSTGAFNALLKILEEPPEHVKFIFATTEPNKVLPTIQSRCQRFDFVNISDQDIAFQLKNVLGKEDITFEEDFIIALSRLANGSMRDSLSLLDRVISAGVTPLTVELLEKTLGIPSRESIAMLAELMGNSDAGGVLRQVDELIIRGMTPLQIIDGLIEYMRDMLVFQTAGAGTNLVTLTEADKKRALALCQKFDPASLVYNITSLEKMRWTIKNADNPRALLEASMVRMSLSEHFINVPDLLKRIAAGAPMAAGGVKKNSTPVTNPNAPLTERFAQACQGQNERAGSAASMATAVRDASASTPAGDNLIRSSRRRADAPNVQQAPNAAPARPAMRCADMDSLSQNWGAIVQSCQQKAPLICSTLSNCSPSAFDGSVLTLAFTNKMALELSQSKKADIEQLLQKTMGTAVRLKYQLDENGAQVKRRSAGSKMSEKDKAQVSSDPAVKTILSGFKARIVDIRYGQ